MHKVLKPKTAGVFKIQFVNGCSSLKHLKNGIACRGMNSLK